MKSKIVAAVIAVGIMASVSNAEIISKNGVAKDTATGLMWQDDSDAAATKKNWDGAKEYCQDLKLGGKKDWKLPNIYELVTLVDNTKKEEPYIDGFQNKKLSGYWSSTTDENYKHIAWVVGFYDGYVGGSVKVGDGYVRCVRAGQFKFDNLTLLKKEGKVKVSQEWIEKISPATEARRKKELKEEKQTRQNNSNTPSSNSYVSWKVKSKFDNPKSYDPEHSATVYNISCSNGKSDVVSYFYNMQYGQYSVSGRAGIESLDEAANSICGNK